MYNRYKRSHINKHALYEALRKRRDTFSIIALIDLADMQAEKYNLIRGEGVQ